MHWLDEGYAMRMGKADPPVKKGISDKVFQQLQDAYNKKQADNKPAEAALKYVYGNGNRIQAALLAAGIRQPTAIFGMYQAYHESKAFKDPKYLKYNNPSGLKFAGQKGATKGANNYAYFDNLANWAAAMKHEYTKGSNPAGARTIEEFVSRLQNNGYFEDSYDNYLHGLTRARLILRTMPAADAADNTTVYDPNTGISTQKKDEGKGSWFKLHPIWTGAIVAVGAVVAIKAVNNN